MTRLFFAVLFCLPAAFGAACAQGIDFVSIDQEEVIVCPASAADVRPPTFTAPDCRTMPAYEINPHRQFVWIKAEVQLNHTAGPDGEPLAIFISGKMASHVYLNGVLVGTNGAPGPSAETETPGLMDAVIYAPQELFRTGQNEVILKSSAHHGILALAHPVHWIGIATVRNPTTTMLSHYWPSLPTLGLFVLAAMYFCASFLFGEDRRSSAVLCLICIFAGAQVLTEVYRGLVAYEYPLQDIRLILITVFSAGFGVSLAHLVFTIFGTKHVWLLTIIAAALSLSVALYDTGFDQKAAGAMLAPLGLTLAALAMWAFQRRERAFGYFLIVLVFVAANLIFHTFFLDIIFFYIVAILILVLITERALIAARDARQRRLEEARANRLELALEQAQQVEKATELSIKSAGKMERITSDQIIQCRGAGGYAEIITLDGRILLHAATLAEMEELLPSTFIRVHRSHVINTRHVRSLKRDQAGTGTLTLSDDTHVPVSRRIMPSVRQALS